MSDKVQRYVKNSKNGKKGELRTPEIRRLIRTHNKLMSIVLPPRASREQILKIINVYGYTIDHEKATLNPKTAMKRRPKVDMKKVNKMFPKK